MHKPLTYLLLTAARLFNLVYPALAQSDDTTTKYLNVTVTAAVNGSSVLQCWQLTTEFAISTQPGIQGSLVLFLGNQSNATYTVVAPRADGGLHNAPYMQWVIVLSGLLHVTLPNTTAGPETEAWLMGGRYGVLFAADTKDVSVYGHGTAYPGDAESVVLTIPTAGNVPPEHTVLYEGPCGFAELVGS